MSKRLPRPIDDRYGTLLLALEDADERAEAREWLAEAGYRVLEASTKTEAVRAVAQRFELDVVISEHTFCAGEPSVLQAMAAAPSGLSLVLAGAADVFTITQGIAAGARAFLPHPLNEADLLGAVHMAAQAARSARLIETRRVHLPVDFSGVVGTSPRMLEVMETLRKSAPTVASVVILGESGTGKELVARAIHESSGRKGRFVALHLLAMPSGLLESELFGHKKGAFTHALSERKGKLELADGGTLFLDELGDIPLEFQAKLLRVLETREFEPVGGNRPVRSDFRLIAATNHDIEAMIREGKFREELWHRLKVVRVELPPLRERRADVPLLAEHFLKDAATRYQKEVKRIEPDVIKLLSRQPWKGNIRELRHAIESMVVLCEAEALTLRDVPREYRAEGEGVEENLSLAGRTLEEIEQEAIRATLEMTGGNRKHAAELLQIGERTLYRKIDKYEIEL